MDDVRISKYLSYLLRHGALKSNLHVSKDGYVLLNDILNLPQSKSYKLDLAKVRKIVENNDKKRFELKTNDSNEILIRACQGHSIRQLDESELLTEITDPLLFPFVVHGTNAKAYEQIRLEGLRIMNRNHIHFAIGYPENKEVISGMRSNCQIFIEIDLEKAIKDGIKFFISANKVVLSPGREGLIETKYFKTVRNRNRQVVQ